MKKIHYTGSSKDFRKTLNSNFTLERKFGIGKRMTNFVAKKETSRRIFFLYTERDCLFSMMNKQYGETNK